MPEQAAEQQLSSKYATALTLARMAYGIYEPFHLSSTSPEERTWVDTVRTVTAESTDGVDGILARRYGSTKNGPLLDRLADVTLFGLSNMQLVRKGEIQPIHAVVDVVREVGVFAMRAKAESDGQPPIKVGARGRQKTAVKFLTLAVADSPLAANNTLVEVLESIGSAFSIYSGLEYTNKFIKGRKGKSETVEVDTNSPRNGHARKVAKSKFHGVAKDLHYIFPDLKPDHITHISTAAVLGSNLLTLIKPKLGFALAASVYTLASLGDGIDGELARLLEVDGIDGMITDTTSDKWQEIATAATNSLIARRRGNRPGQILNGLAALTAPLPAFFRAKAESKGRIVNEDAIGSRLIRAIEGGIGLGFNQSRQVTNQIGALMLVGNVITAVQRADVALFRGEKSPHCRGVKDDIELREHGKAREEALKPILMAAALVSAAAIAV